jgi:hypothetical protein
MHRKSEGVHLQQSSAMVQESLDNKWLCFASSLREQSAMRDSVIAFEQAQTPAGRPGCCDFSVIQLADRNEP